MHRPDDTITIYHHPGCGTSRHVLALVRHAGFEPRIVPYLETPLTRDELVALVAATGEPVRALLRAKEPLCEALELLSPTATDEDLLDAMAAHPVLMNRPVVTTSLGTSLCRPSESVLTLLPVPALPPFVKEDGERVVDDGVRRPVPRELLAS